MELFNSLATSIFDALLYPLSFLGSDLALILISIVAGIGLLFLYGKVSNQEAIKKVKRKIAAGIYESVLFRNDLRISLKAQGKMFLGGAKYFALAIPPIIILSIPCLIVLAQLNLRYGVRPLNPGESTIISIGVKDDAALFSAEIKTPEGISATPPLRDLDNHTVSWRLDAKTAIIADVNIVVGGESLSQNIFVGQETSKIPTVIHSSFWWQFLYPGATIPTKLKEIVTEVSVRYPEQVMHLAGLQTNWLIVFLIVSILAGIVGSKFLKIEI